MWVTCTEANYYCNAGLRSMKIEPTYAHRDTTIQSPKKLLQDWCKKNIPNPTRNCTTHFCKTTASPKPSTTPSSPLVSVYDSNGQLISDLWEVCQSMRGSVISLGDPPNFDIDSNFMVQLMTISSKLLDDVPLSQCAKQHFEQLFSNAKPHTAPRFDETSFSFCFLSSLTIFKLSFATSALSSSCATYFSTS